jgi:flagellar M-ring protein FliF
MPEQDIVPIDGPVRTTMIAQPLTSAALLDGISDFYRRPIVKKMLPMIGISATILLVGTAWWTFQSPSQLPVYAGLSDADKATVTDALRTAGIPFALDPQTGVVTVGEDDVHKARIMLAGQGLPKAAPAGDALLDALPLGASRALEGDTLRSAREADLARTIERIQAVKSARVMLAQAEASPFLRDDVPAAASILLTLETGRSLDAAQVKAIRFLVASAIPGLTPAQVSVVDQSGTLLSDDSETPDDKNFKLQLRVEDRLRKAVSALLLPVLGAANFSAEVHADVDFTESQSTRETFPKDERVLRSEQGNKTVNDSPAGAAAGIPGALSNQPPLASQVATTPGNSASPTPAPNQTESAESFSRNFDVGREIAVTHQPVGRLRRITVAVAVKAGARPLSAGDTAQLEALVKAAIGFDTARGDAVAVTARPFIKVETPIENIWDKPWFGSLLRQVGGLLAGLAVFVVIGRPLMRRLKRDVIGHLGADTASTELALLQAVGTERSKPITLDMIEAAPAYEDRASLVRQFVRQDPARATLVVQNMVSGAKND